MPKISPLKTLVDAALAKKTRINADDAHAILAEVEKDKKFKPDEMKELKRLTKLPASRFIRKDEFIANPNDPEDGMNVKTNPKAWLESEVELGEATLKMRSSLPGVTVTLGNPKEFNDDDFGSYFSRKLAVSVTGKNITRDGTLSFTYGKHNVSVQAKKGETMEHFMDKVTNAILRSEGGSVQYSGYVSPTRSTKQTVTYEVL